MLSQWAAVRPGERRETLLGFFTYLAFMTGHSALETARDALFLSRVSVSKLPWVYLAIAVASLGLGALPRGESASSRGKVLSAGLVGASLVTVAFVPLAMGRSTTALYAFYLWTAVLATSVTTQISILLAERFTVTQAKRLYPLIGLGSVLGAIVGSGSAALLATLFSPVALVVFGASFIALSALFPYALSRSAKPPRLPEIDAGRTRERGAMSTTWAIGYARRVGAIVLFATLTVTFVDFVFKSEVAAKVPAEDLGRYFGQCYVAFNVLSLVVQLVVARPLLQRFSVTTVLAILPGLLAGGSLGLGLAGGLGTATATWAADGALRYSVFRTALELLYLPLPERIRATVKTVTDVVGQRGGQALASLLILGATWMGFGHEPLALVAAGLAAVWFAIALGTRKSYLDLFRSTLRETAVSPRVPLPEIDLSSLEAILAALNSPVDAEVRAAMHLLDDRGKARTIPALILYHPSPDVVCDALEIFSHAGRTDFLRIADRLIHEGPPAVRAAALRTHAEHHRDPEFLRPFLQDPEREVAATAAVGLVASNELDPETLKTQFEKRLKEGGVASGIAFANAVAHRPHVAFEPFLPKLAEMEDLGLRRAALAAMKVMPSAKYLGVLVRLLPNRELRSDAREVLAALSDTGLSFIEGSLADESLPKEIRRHLPRTLLRFDPLRASRVLVERLPVELDGVVRFKILRALGRLVADHPQLPLDAVVLDGMCERTIRRVLQLVDWQVGLARGAKTKPAYANETHRLLVDLLRSKEMQGIERLFRLLGLVHRDEDLAAIYRGLRARDGAGRASSRELLEHVLPEKYRSVILGLVDETPNEEKLAVGKAFYTPFTGPYEDLLGTLLEGRSESVRSIAVYHIGELGLRALRPRLEAMRAPEEGYLAGVLRAVIDAFEPRTSEG